jgi:pimeloyl-ACP methyl ester carboxylesterase
MVHPSRLTDRSLIEGILDMFESKSADLYEAQIRALLTRANSGPLLQLIRCPALALCGHEDSWSPPHQHRVIAATIRECTFVDVPGCGHMSTLECPDKVSEALRGWLTRVK